MWFEQTVWDESGWKMISAGFVTNFSILLHVRVTKFKQFTRKTTLLVKYKQNLGLEIH